MGYYGHVLGLLVTAGRGGKRRRSTDSTGRRFFEAPFQDSSRPIPACWRRWLLILLSLSAVPRVAVGLMFEPFWYPDSKTYDAMAHMFLQGDLSGYDALRTPGYPAFMALFGGSLDAVRAAQLLLGLLTTALLFGMALRLTGSLVAAFASGAFYGLNIVHIHFEGAILSESLSALLIVASMYLAVSVMLGDTGESRRGKQLGLGLVAAAAVVTRPALALVPLVAFLATLSSQRSKLKAAMLMVLPSIVAIVGWSAFNYATVGSFSPTSIGGLAMFTHVRPLVQDAPPEYANIVAVDKELAEVAGGTVSEWRVAEELASREGRSIPEVSSEMLALSMRLVMSHPAHYARNVVLGSMSFWKGYGRGDFRWRDSLGIIKPVWTAEKLVMFIGMGIVFCIAVLMVACRPRKVIRTPRGRIWVSLAAVVVLSCLFQAFTQFGANARYGVPFQPLYALCGVVFIHETIRIWRSRGSTQLPS